ncbi:MAG: Rieske 2Fe-2S domain-containing protein [Woeseiaceae bacterium]|nr:Rieske 2Fe-2S domain-containing protein [Woeseiaceae bacterium]
MRRAPDESAFPEYPESWYLLCSAGDIDRGPLSLQALGKDLVAFRTEGGEIVVMDGRCSHMGADLGRGRVRGDCIECPFHGWQYGPDGSCAHVPGAAEVPEAAKQAVYPAVERHGLVFFFNGEKALFPLPFIFDAAPEDYVAAKPVTFIADCTWYMVAAHGYDTQHFETVHSRRLHAPLVVDCPAPFARRSTYTADVLGNAYYDRLLRRFAGKTVRISITTWGGTIVVITGEFANATSRFMICLQPIEDGKTECTVVPFAPGIRNPAARWLIQPLSLWVRRLFTGGYLIAETEALGSPRYNPRSLIEADREMIEYFHWVTNLPASADAGTGGA